MIQSAQTKEKQMSERTIYRDGLRETIDARGIRVSRTREGHVVERYWVNGVPKFFVTLAGSHWCAHGESIANAVADALWKDPEQRPSMELLRAKIQKAGHKYKISLNEFRLLTGACREGCLSALKAAGLPNISMTAADIRDKISREWGNKLISILGWQLE